MSTVNMFKAKANNCFKLTVIGLSLICLSVHKSNMGAANMAKEAIFFIGVSFITTVLMHENGPVPFEQCKSKYQKCS